MTRRDYVLIAKVVKDIGDGQALCMDNAEDRVRLAVAFAEALIPTNPAFDVDRFMSAACTASDIEEYDSNPNNF